jgi:hypothetical protein
MCLLYEVLIETVKWHLNIKIGLMRPGCCVMLLDGGTADAEFESIEFGNFAQLVSSLYFFLAH